MNKPNKRSGRRPYLLGFRASPGERGAILKLAQVEGRTISEAIRETMRRVCNERGVWPVETERQE